MGSEEWSSELDSKTSFWRRGVREYKKTELSRKTGADRISSGAGGVGCHLTFSTSAAESKFKSDDGICSPQRQRSALMQSPEPDSTRV